MAIKDFESHDYKDGRGEDARDVRKVKISFQDKLTALDKLSRYQGIPGFVSDKLAAQDQPVDMAAVIEELTRRPINPDPNNVYIPPPPKAKRALLGPAAPYRPPKTESSSE